MTADLLERARVIQSGSAQRHAWVAARAIVGLGWATVELDRAEGELGATWCTGWKDASRDELLGASVRRCGDDGLPLLLLEPDTEGRLAAYLARHGEGVAAVYLDGGPAGEPGEAPTSGLGPAAPGPLGRARLLRDGTRWGPYVVVLEP